MPPDAEIEGVSLRDNLATGRGSVTDLSPLLVRCIEPPALMIGDVTRELMRVYVSQVLVLWASVYRVPGAEVVGEGLVFVDGRFNWCDQLNIESDYIARHRRDLIAGLKNLRRLELDDDVVLLVGNGYYMYGHWIIDYLPKLYLLHLAGYRIDRLKFLLPVDTPGFAREWLKLLGIDDGQLVLYDRGRDRLVCRSLIVPSGLRVVNRVSPLLREARAFLLAKVEPRRWRWVPRPKPARPRRRVFVSRSENVATFNRRRLVERAEFEAKSAERGFDVVRPETLSIPDQIGLFRSAGAIYGEYGSGLHASLFAEPGCCVVAVRNNHPGLGFVQSAIDQAVDHANGYVIGGPPDENGNFSAHGEDIDTAFDWLDWKGFG